VIALRERIALSLAWHSKEVYHFSQALQARALEQAVKEINGHFGKNSIMLLGGADFGEV
jgi:hypothetical protein